MNFQVFGSRVKIFFLITVIFLFLTIAMFATFLAFYNTGSYIWYLLMFIWFGTATTLLFHFLLLRNLPFLQKLDIARASNYSFFLSLIVYIIFFPIIAILSLLFLVIFTIALFVLSIIHLFSHHKKDKSDQE